MIPSGSIELKMGSVIIGHASFRTDPITNLTMVDVIFDGEDDIFDEDGGYSTVNAGFSAEFEFDLDSFGGVSGNNTITILEKNYILHTPVVETLYNVEKSGVIDFSTQSVEWTVDVSATQKGVGIDLDGYKFFDDLSSVGGYVAGSFKIDETPVIPDTTGNTISYEFPSGSQSPKRVKFRTEISDSKFYATSEQGIRNKAQLLDGSDVEMDSGSSEVKFTPKWIEKSGLASDKGSTGVYDPTVRTITWTVIANHMEASLNNVIITDVLKDGLTFNSATWQEWDGSDWSATATNITPNASG